jgi:hypothetical protein
MIPSPNLDDRRFDDIVDEAIRMIPQYCPDWTNFNKADPGITLLELFAWMTEMIIYRLNQVPEKNYLAFLNMMGLRLRPPQPARSLCHFKISEKVDQVRIPRGTRLGTKPTGERGAIDFETETDLLAHNNKLVRCMSQYAQTFSDNSPLVEGGRGGFEIFGGARSIERYLYLGDPRLAAFSEDAILFVRFEAQGATEREFHELLEWEYWDGSRWRELIKPSLEPEKNTVAFQGPPNFSPTAVNEVQSSWLRGRLFEVPRGDDETVLDTISARLEVMGDGVTPDLAIGNPEGDRYHQLDLDKNFLPLGKEPAIDATLYLACEEIIGQVDATIRIELVLSDQVVADAPRPSHELVLRWEYNNGKRWKPLGRVHFKDDLVETEYDFKDGTRCLSQSGVITFSRPKDIAPVTVSATEARFIRCRVELGNYGVPGTYQLEGDTWVWKDDHPLRPPTLKSLSFKFQESAHPLEHVFVYNDFVYTDHSKVAAQEYKPFQAFQPVAEESPTLFMGWENPFPNETCAIYFNIADSESRGGVASLSSTFEDRSDGAVEQRVVWEYWNGKAWAPLAPHDSTENFTQSGFIAFVGPADFRKSRRFAENMYWMRARLEMGGYDEPPRCDRILINATYTLNVTTFGETPLGSSRGLPNQFYLFPNGPVLDSEVVVVREPEKLRPEVVEALTAKYGEGAVTEDADQQGFWVRWTPVESFFDHSAEDRVYVKDISKNRIDFGDGIHGMLPAKGERNVRATRYQVGGGEAGNVPVDSIVVLKQALAFVEGVNNPYPAVGGCDMESVEEAKLRAPHMLKARNRAVTVDDFEWLAREASNSVARVKCLPSTAREGEVTVIVIPKVPVSSNLSDKPIPTSELLKKVKKYLSERKLVSTLINVVRPSYAEISIEVEIVRLTTGASDRIRRDTDKALRRFLHPLVGGRSGKGWDFGRAILKVDLYHVVENVDGVDFVDKIRVFDEELGAEVDQLKLKPDQLVHLVNVTVVEKAHDRIL